MTAGFRAAHPLCAECEARGLDVPGTVVDHVVPHRGDWTLYSDEDNWQRLCDACHGVKTVGERTA